MFGESNMLCCTLAGWMLGYEGGVLFLQESNQGQGRLEVSGSMPFLIKVRRGNKRSKVKNSEGKVGPLPPEERLL